MFWVVMVVVGGGGSCLNPFYTRFTPQFNQCSETSPDLEFEPINQFHSHAALFTRHPLICIVQTSDRRVFISLKSHSYSSRVLLMIMTITVTIYLRRLKSL